MQYVNSIYQGMAGYRKIRDYFCIMKDEFPKHGHDINELVGDGIILRSCWEPYDSNQTEIHEYAPLLSTQ
ncbi:CNT_collapsed_G0025810.mRNA.1.CDS.1 [Saccharomyces cerevisiae]|nr:CNT_collapsed_G0025810.mRNA.1.CDS.1 [Saccharomyces cerevisiae]